jgi:hypothetical protein
MNGIGGHSCYAGQRNSSLKCSIVWDFCKNNAYKTNAYKTNAYKTNVYKIVIGFVYRWIYLFLIRNAFRDYFSTHCV